MSRILFVEKYFFVIAILIWVGESGYGSSQLAPYFAQDVDSMHSERNVSLNRFEFAPGELDYYRKLRSDGVPEQSNPEAWLSLYDRLRKAAHPRALSRFPDWRTLMQAEEKNNSDANIIPIGILDIEGEYVSGDAQAGNQIEKIRFIDASVLQEKLYQAEAKFKIGGSLFISNKLSVTAVEIDFGDGKGYRSYALKDQVIKHTFAATGHHGIQIRIRTEKGFHVFQTAIEVLQLQRYSAFRNYQITAPPIVRDTASYRVGNVRQAASIMLTAAFGLSNSEFLRLLFFQTR